MRRAILVVAGVVFLLISAVTLWSSAAGEAPAAKQGESLYAYDESDPPAVFFFPPDEARWDGSRITIREWYLLTDLQKQKFISEYLDQMRKVYRAPIEVISMDYLRALNTFSSFSADRNAAQPTTAVINRLLEAQGKVAQKPVAAVSRTPPASVTKIVTQVGDTISITLASNPTTGYRWQLDEPFRKDIIQLVSSDYEPDKTGMVGSGGREIWTFRAIQRGVTAVVLTYRRPWEKGGDAAKRARFVIAVLPPETAEEP